MNTDNLVAHSRARFDHEVARRTLQEKYQAKMIFAHAGGMWSAGPELLTTLHVCSSSMPMVMLDLYNTPVQIVPGELFELASQRWQEQMNAWLVEYQQLTQTR